MIIAKIDEYVPIEFSPAICSQDFEGMPTLLFHLGLELLEVRECIGFLLDEVHPHHSSVVINEEEKNIFFHQSWGYLMVPRYQHAPIEVEL